MKKNYYRCLDIRKEIFQNNKLKNKSVVISRKGKRGEGKVRDISFGGKIVFKS